MKQGGTERKQCWEAAATHLALLVQYHHKLVPPQTRFQVGPPGNETMLDGCLCRMENILKNGLDVAGRHFDLLAYSSGQASPPIPWCLHSAIAPRHSLQENLRLDCPHPGQPSLNEGRLHTFRE